MIAADITGLQQDFADTKNGTTNQKGVPCRISCRIPSHLSYPMVTLCLSFAFVVDFLCMMLNLIVAHTFQLLDIWFAY